MLGDGEGVDGCGLATYSFAKIGACLHLTPKFPKHCIKLRTFWVMEGGGEVAGGGGGRGLVGWVSRRRPR